jgi:hypothetical protein
MGTVKQVKEAFEKAYNSIPEAVAMRVQETQDVLLDLNRDQLLQGRDADGKVLKPGYLQDPYFDSEESGRWFHRARSYLKMKIGLEAAHRGRMRFGSVELFPDKNKNTPNLIITGPFQDSMFIRVTKESYTIGSTYKDEDDISAKYKDRVFGIAPKTKWYYYFAYIRQVIEKLYKK